MVIYPFQKRKVRYIILWRRSLPLSDDARGVGSCRAHGNGRRCGCEKRKPVQKFSITGPGADAGTERMSSTGCITGVLMKQ